MRKILLIPIAAMAVLALPATGAASEATPGPAVAPHTLGAWLGCWRPVDAAAPTDAMICVLPGENAASVRIATMEEGVIAEEALLSVDGVARPVEEGGCTGMQTAQWSADGRRVYLSTELDCNGIGRTSTGVIAFVAENEWVDVQTVTIMGQDVSRTLRYRAVRPENAPESVAALLPRGQEMVTESARMHASAALDFDAVLDATRNVSAPAVETLIAARRHGFALNADRLVQLERAGVPVSVIDMMIAVSYPQRFAVQDGSQQQTFGELPATYRSGMSVLDECRDPRFSQLSPAECEVLLLRQYSRYGYRGSTFGSSFGYRGYGYGYGYGYSPWGYDPYGWNYGVSRPVIVVVPSEQRQRGEVVKGQGYTRGGAPSTGRNARSRDDRAGSPPPSSSGSSAGAPTRTETTGSSSSGTSTGRTAVPRNGGGGQ